MSFLQKLISGTDNTIEGIVSQLQRLYGNEELTVQELEMRLKDETGFASSDTAKAEQLAAALAAAQADVTRLTGELSDAQSAIEAAGNTIELANAKIATLEQEAQAHATAMEAAQNKFNALSAEFAAYKVAPKGDGSISDPAQASPASAKNDGVKVVKTSAFADLK